MQNVGGPTDPNAPRIYSLFPNGTQTNVSISNIYQVNDWNWDTKTRGAPMQSDGGVTNLGATMVGFNQPSGVPVLVPQANYDIGDGYQAVLMYATKDSAVIKYTPSDFLGDDRGYYMIHLENFSVDPSILMAYDQARADGKLVWLGAGQQLGLTAGELLVAMRDSGSFMDLRIIKDWWQNPLNKPSNKQLLIRKSEVSLEEKRTISRIYCESPNEGFGVDEAKVTCPGNCGLKFSQVAYRTVPTYVPGQGKPSEKQMEDRTLTYGVGVQGIACGQTRSDSAVFTEYAPYDLFNPKDLCEKEHEWVGEMSIRDIELPFAGYLVRYLAGTLSSEYLSREKFDDLMVRVEAGDLEANKEFWRRQGVLGRLLPEETQLELKAEFVRYIQRRGAATMYKDFLVDGIKLVSLITPPEKPSRDQLKQNPALMTDYREKFAGWLTNTIGETTYRDFLSRVGLFPNEAARGQIKVDLCGDRTYQDQSLMIPYPDSMRLGLAANQLFQLTSPAEAQEVYYKRAPQLREPYKTLNRAVEMADASEQIPPADQFISQAEAGEETIFIPQEKVKKQNNSIISWFENLFTKLREVISPAYAVDCGDVFAMDVEAIPDSPGYVVVVSRTDCGKKRFPGLVHHLQIYQDKDAGGNGEINTFYISECSKDGSVCPDVRFLPDYLPKILPKFSTYEEMKDWIINGPLRLRADDQHLSPRKARSLRLPTEQIMISGGGGQAGCDPAAACCESPTCTPKYYPSVQYGPPETRWVGLPGGRNGGHMVFGYDWTPAGKKNPVKLVFKKDEWKKYTEKNILPADCQFIKQKEPGPSCSINGGCPGWGAEGAWGCNKDKGICEPFQCVRVHDREGAVYNVYPYGWSLWENMAANCYGECYNQYQEEYLCKTYCQNYYQVLNDQNLNQNPLPAGIFTMLKPAFLDLTKAVSDTYDLANTAGAQNPDYKKVFDNYGNYRPVPAASKVNYSFTMNFILSEGVEPFKKGISDVVMSQAGQNLLFYRLGGVCNATKYFSEQVLNPAGFGPKSIICGTAPGGTSALGGISRADLPDLPEVDACDILVSGPPDDNGRCVHFASNGRLSEIKINDLIEKMKQMNIKWALVPYGADENELKKYATAFKGSGIQPIWRPLLSPHQNYQANSGWARDTKLLVDMGYKNPIIQIYNEPLNEHEWGGKGVDEGLWLNNLTNAAAEIYKAGGLPGIQIMDGAELKMAIEALRAKGGQKLLDRIVVIPHLYSADGRTPGSTNEYSILGQLYDIQKTLDEEGISNTPVISGESGFKESTVGYDLQKQADFTKETMDWFITGKLSDGKDLPPNFVTMCHWQLTGYGAAQENIGGSWFDNGIENGKPGQDGEKHNITDLLRGDDKYKTRIQVVCPPKKDPRGGNPTNPDGLTPTENDNPGPLIPSGGGGIAPDVFQTQ